MGLGLTGKLGRAWVGAWVGAWVHGCGVGMNAELYYLDVGVEWEEDW